MECHYYPPQQPSPVLDYPYYEDEDVQSSTTQSPSTSSLHSFSSSFDNRSPPRSIPQQHFLPPTSSPTSSNPLNQHFGYSTQLAMSQPSQQQWSSNRRSTPISSFQLQGQLHSDDMAFNPTSSYVTTSENDMYSNSTIPRGWKNCNERILHSHNNNGLPSFAAIDYGDEDVNERNNQHTQLDSAMYQSLGNGRGYAPMCMASHHDCSSSPSHYPSLENLKFHSKTTTFSLADDGMSNAGTGTASREMTVEDEEGLGMDEPYAKLIHRALMSKPDHSMVLQDIYQWFRENTNKGSSDNKGWMNSIRHNLSMNAAFKKTERKTAGDESKKSTEWVLEDFAIKEGVQSTTRYRKGTANKKSIRSGTPAPSRQRSGQKGGFSTRNTTRLRSRIAGDQYRRPRIDTSGGSLRGFPGHFQQRLEDRHREPLTPPQNESLGLHFASPYYTYHGVPTAKLEQYGGLGFDGLCDLEGVQGVHMDGGPVFAFDADMPYKQGCFRGLSGYDHRS